MLPVLLNLQNNYISLRANIKLFLLFKMVLNFFGYIDHFVMVIDILILLISSGCCIGVINLIPHRRSIFDVGHYFIPTSPKTWIPEVTILFFILYNIRYGSHSHEIIKSIGLFMFFRFMTMWLTILPSLNRRSSIRYGGIVGGHNDYLPVSGHIGVLYILVYFSESLGYFGWVTLLAVIVLMLSERRHYTIEMLMSIVIGWFIIKTYTENEVVPTGCHCIKWPFLAPPTQL